MTDWNITPPSKEKIKRCGELVREYVYEDREVADDDLEQAIQVISWFRAQHAYPMTKVRLGLASMVRTEHAPVIVSQRLKRVPRIIRKLQRTVGSPTGRTALSRLEDIGGVRAILRDGPELERVRRRVERQWKSSFAREPRDYIARPKPIGYRAAHFIVERDGRAIEVQLRTRGQQQWADAAEIADARLHTRGVNLKDSEGPPEMLEFFTISGEVIYRREYGIELSTDLLARFDAARQAVIREGFYSA